MGEGQREGDTESETGSRLWAVSTEPDAGLELTDREIMTWGEVGRLTDWATQAPQICNSINNNVLKISLGLLVSNQIRNFIFVTWWKVQE